MGAEGVATVSYRTIWNMAHGYHEPLLKNMKAVAKVLNEDIGKLF